MTRTSEQSRAIRSIGYEGAVESARRLQRRQRAQMLRAQARNRGGNPRPFERIIHASDGRRRS